MDMTELLPPARAMIRTDEGMIAWLYKDKKNNITTGPGVMLPDLRAARQLPWQCALTSLAVTAEDIERAWQAVQTMPAGLPAERYKQHHDRAIRLSDDTMAQMLDRKIAQFTEDLLTSFPGYVDWPLPAQLGMLDMAYNLGMPRLIDEFPHFCAAANQDPPDYATMADECHRLDISETRNDATRNRFLAATE